MNASGKAGATIKRLREQRAWSQPDLAKAAKLPVRTIGRIERSEVDVRLGTLSKIAKALRKRPRDLLP